MRSRRSLLVAIALISMFPFAGEALKSERVGLNSSSMKIPALSLYYLADMKKERYEALFVIRILELRSWPCSLTIAPSVLAILQPSDSVQRR